MSDDVAADLLARLNESRISTRSDSNKDSSPASKFHDAELENKKLKEEARHQAMDPLPLHVTVGTTPQGIPVGDKTQGLTPEQKQAITWMEQLKKYTPDTKESKRANLPTSVKFNGDRSKFEDFKNSLEGHYI